MSAYKPLLASDIIVTPLEVNKAFAYHTPAAINQAGISMFTGKNITGLFSTQEATTGTISVEYQRLVYKTISELYYSNYQSSSYGDEISVPLILPNEYTSGPVSSAGRYENYLQTDLTFERYFPTASDAIIGVYSIPQNLYGDKIQPNTFRVTSPKGAITDDGEGNLIINTTPNTIVGTIIYQHGVAIITRDTAVAVTGIIDAFMTSSTLFCSFSSSYDIYETQYKCTINPPEYNFTLNESVISGSSTFEYSSSFFYQPEDGIISNFATASTFTPYITGVGLYNENQELLAIAKLAQPLPTSRTTDTTIVVNLDR